MKKQTRWSFLFAVLAMACMSPFSLAAAANPLTGDSNNMTLILIIGGAAVVICGILLYLLSKKKKDGGDQK